MPLPFSNRKGVSLPFPLKPGGTTAGSGPTSPHVLFNAKEFVFLD